MTSTYNPAFQPPAQLPPRDSLERVEAEMQAEIAAEANGPVRRRTVTEVSIASGTYGVVEVANIYAGDPGTIGVRIANRGSASRSCSASELRAAAATLTELADALDEQGGAK